MIHARIAGTGSYLPGEPIGNADLIATYGIDSSDEWIVERTGIRQRHFSPLEEGSSRLAYEASLRALAAAGRRVDEIDLLIVATSTPDMVFPSTATILSNKLGLPYGVPAFDLQAVCSGFVYALTVAEKFIASGSHRCVLVVGAEVFSRLLDWQDRSTCVLFGDGAGAAVLEASDAPGVLASTLHAEGSQIEILSVPGQVGCGRILGDPFVRMDGKAVFKFAVKSLTDAAHEVLQRAGVAVEQVDWLIPHQANVRILQATAKRLGMANEKCIVSVTRHGNTSAASIPLALDEAVRAGRIRRGQKLLLVGVGAGFTWGAVLLDY